MLKRFKKKDSFLAALLLGALLLVACSPGASPSVAEASADTQEVEGWAVLAGKEDYSDVERLKGHDLTTNFVAHNRFHALLRYSGWQEDHILELRDELGQEEIREALEWLASNADEDDFVIFYYFGHGSYLREEVRWADFFAEEWAKVPGRYRLLMIDSCHAEEHTRVVAGEERGHVAIASVADDEVSWGGLWEERLPILGPVFTYYFIEAHYNPTVDYNVDGRISIGEATAWAEEQQRTYMHSTVWSNPRFAWSDHEDHPDVPHVMVDDTVGAPIYLDLDANRPLQPSEGAELRGAAAIRGERIAFSSNRAGKLDIYVMSADGSEVARVTRDEYRNAMPSWSPDGQQIAFTAFLNAMKIQVINLGPATAPAGAPAAPTPAGRWPASRSPRPTSAAPTAAPGHRAGWPAAI